MPAIPQDPNGTPPYTHPPNPNAESSRSAQATSKSITHQPSPAVLSTSSHKGAHVLPRRFLGPIPENVVNSSEAIEKRRHLRKIRRKVVKTLIHSQQDGFGGDEDEGGEGGDGSEGRIRRVAHRFKTRGGRKVELPGGLEENDSSDSEDSSGENSKGKGKRKKRKDVWVGESFDIGREFKSIPASSTISSEDSQDDDEERSGNGEGPSSRTAPKRPKARTQNTQETFVTARTRLSDPRASRSTLSLPQPNTDGYDLGVSTSHSPDSTAPTLPRDHHNSGSSSLRPLMNLDNTSTEGEPSRPVAKSTKTAPPGLKTRLKSAIRLQPSFPDIDRTETRLDKAKTVQFPVDPVQQNEGNDGDDEEEEVRKGNKKPVDPEDVLAREGGEVAGTSAGAAEEALQEEEADETSYLPGEVILRDRMLVRVAHHREDNLARFDEAVQRRSPCSRMEPTEEYIGVWRRGRVELYQDWGTRIRERIQGQKRLHYIIPLEPSRTSLSIFNTTDMTLTLATSAGRLENYMDQIARSNTTRTSAIKDRVKQSKTAKWLRHGRQGTHIFILKIAERSRALDWYWELWRELGGELPGRFDIQVPSLSTSVRLLIPVNEDDDVGGKETRKILNRKKVVDTCWEMIKQTVDVDDLLSQRSDKDGRLELELVWKGVDGTLDWVGSDTTVTGLKRDWSVLAGIAESTNGRYPRELQLRQASHQPRNLHLEDGTTINEPPGIEGYLIRHKSAASSKTHIYLTTYDGNVFLCSMGHAIPPLTPKAEGSTPGELFREVEDSFRVAEKVRAARLIEHSVGCVDLRDIEKIVLVNAGVEGSDVAPVGKVDEANKSFEVTIKDGSVIRFEAHTPEIAAEWVNNLQSLKTYWTRRHRVEARIRMDATAVQSREDVFACTGLSEMSDQVLSNVWDWCVIDGCRAVCLAGRLFMKTGKYGKFRAKYVILTGGCLVTFKIRSKHSFLARKKRYPLYGAYTYSGILAQDELRDTISEDPFSAHSRVYQDGLQSSDGPEDTTFCVRLSTKPKRWGQTRTHPWDIEPEASFLPPPLSKQPPHLLIVRTRSKLERDRWIWAINSEMERQVRSHLPQEERLRMVGKIPAR